MTIDGYLFTNSGNGKNPAVRYWKCVGFKTNNCSVTAKTVGQTVIQLSGVVNAPDHGLANDPGRMQSINFKV